MEYFIATANDGPAASLLCMSVERGGAHLRAMSALLHVPEGRSASLTLGAFLSLADDDGDGDGDNGRIRGGRRG